MKDEKRGSTGISEMRLHQRLGILCPRKLGGNNAMAPAGDEAFKS